VAAPPKRRLVALLGVPQVNLNGMVTVLKNTTVIIESPVRDVSIELFNSVIVVLGFNLELVVTANGEGIVFHNKTHYAPTLKKVKTRWLTLFDEYQS
jgi:hypothetical protein